MAGKELEFVKKGFGEGDINDIPDSSITSLF